MVIYLLCKGADVNAPCSPSALMVACNEGHYNIVELLPKRGWKSTREQIADRHLQELAQVAVKRLLGCFFGNRPKTILRFLITQKRQVIGAVSIFRMAHYPRLYHAVLWGHKPIIQL